MSKTAAPAQEKFFFRHEADAWFARTLEGQARGSYGADTRRGVIEVMRRAGLKPKVLLEVGGAGGMLSDALRAAFGCKVTMVEPSGQAVRYANKTYRGIKAIRGVASRLPLPDRSVDTVVIKGVLCWVGRESLLGAVSEIDRVLVDGGHLVIKDYLPDSPRKNANHHVKTGDIYCFKTDHAAIFRASGLYTDVLTEIYVDPKDSFPGCDLFDTRNQIVVLRKSYLGYYADRRR